MVDKDIDHSLHDSLYSNLPFHWLHSHTLNTHRQINRFNRQFSHYTWPGTTGRMPLHPVDFQMFNFSCHFKAAQTRFVTVYCLNFIIFLCLTLKYIFSLFRAPSHQIKAKPMIRLELDYRLLVAFFSKSENKDRSRSIRAKCSALLIKSRSTPTHLRKIWLSESMVCGALRRREHYDQKDVHVLFHQTGSTKNTTINCQWWRQLIVRQVHVTFTSMWIVYTKIPVSWLTSVTDSTSHTVLTFT